MQVEGSAALITGGGTGVGRETTLALARLGRVRVGVASQHGTRAGR